jgi:hypothetical protein
LLLPIGQFSWLILFWDHLFWILPIIRHYDEVRDDHGCRLHLNLLIRVSAMEVVVLFLWGILVGEPSVVQCRMR